MVAPARSNIDGGAVRFIGRFVVPLKHLAQGSSTLGGQSPLMGIDA
jgi:hypothetical protein